MKKVMILTILFALLNSAAQALTVEQQQEALNQLQIARAEINTIKGLVPGFLKSTIGRSLKNADERIAYAQGVLAMTNVSASYFCTIDSSFDGQFSGRGGTQLEASNAALESCERGSTHHIMFCEKDTTRCQKEN